MLHLSRDPETTLDTFEVLQQLDTGIVNHAHWLKLVNRALVCADATPAAEDLSPDAHQNCPFGRWFYEQADIALREEDEFQELGLVHEQMHDAARQLLAKRQRGETLATADYDLFLEKADGFKTAMRRLQERFLGEVSAVDRLTGAWNRHALFFKLDEEHERVSRLGDASAVCMMSLDGLDGIRTEHGEAAQAALLRAVTEFVAGRLRKFDSVFRYGDEEFVLCLPDTGVDTAAALLEDVRNGLAEQPFDLGPSGSRVTITACFGVSALRGGTPLAETMAEADYALNEARGEGPNRLHVWRG
ncbi:MAG TPA: diguanylate cyclase [Gammaproteobacteria bacterium]|nr:diguanylate cyclase [Gammaproteobacteria bacterium]